MDELQRHSALASNTAVYAASGFKMRELPNVTKLRVQLIRERGMKTPLIHPEKLPPAPNTAAGVDPFALWKAPDDWLVYSQTLAADALGDWTSTSTGGAPLALTDVSSGSAVIELHGPRVIDVLMRDCTLDLEGDEIPVKGCAQTLFAHTTVLIHRPPEPVSSWRIFVERSVALHVWEWLADSAGPALGAATQWQ